MSPKIIKKEQGLYVIEGELNMQTVPNLSQQLVGLFPQIEESNITMDFASVTRSDSAGVALLVEIIQLAKLANLNLSFTGLPQQMQDIAALSDLLEILPINK